MKMIKQSQKRLINAVAVAGHSMWRSGQPATGNVEEFF
jgi:hypothetical protein